MLVRQHIRLATVTMSLFFLLFSCGIKKALVSVPDITVYNAQTPLLEKINDSTFFAGNNFLTKNNQGLWEMYVEGDPYQRGLLIGKLTKPLMDKQETVFMKKIQDLVPSDSRQKFLRKFLAWYNRKMPSYIPDEYKAEIYGVSRYASDEYNELAPPYMRALYLHSAHDIGHALQDLALVGCTSFAVWDNKSEDGNLLVGRNFDFYAGDEFAEDKIIAFINPDHGHKFISVSWGGMIGVVSGMNDQGLTVTINAGKSKIPLVAKTPISIVAREILQYASNIDEAVIIAKKRKVFVSESIMISSAQDKKAVLIEVSPNNIGVFEVEKSDQLICSNHFQSEVYEDDKRNLKTVENSHTQYRYDRMQELLSEEKKINAQEAVEILRNKHGLNDIELGYGNEKAINQLLAHHGIVFKPEELKVWISSNPYQLGEFVAYDLNEVFRNREKPSLTTVSSTELNIEEDPFIYTEQYKDYEKYRKLERNLESSIELGTLWPEKDLSLITELNQNYWKSYHLVGRYYFEIKDFTSALNYFEKAISREVASLEDEKLIKSYIRKSSRKIKR